MSTSIPSLLASLLAHRLCLNVLSFALLALSTQRAFNRCLMSVFCGGSSGVNIGLDIRPEELDDAWLELDEAVDLYCARRRANACALGDSAKMGEVGDESWSAKGEECLGLVE